MSLIFFLDLLVSQMHNHKISYILLEASLPISIIQVLIHHRGSWVHCIWQFRSSCLHFLSYQEPIIFYALEVLHHFFPNDILLQIMVLLQLLRLWITLLFFLNLFNYDGVDSYGCYCHLMSSFDHSCIFLLILGASYSMY